MLVPQDLADQERLKSWLISILIPQCQADPVALAKYIMALIKKDRQEGELKDLCLEQLKAFLEDNTESFVKVLFSALRDKSYLVPTSKCIQMSSWRPNLRVIVPEGQSEKNMQGQKEKSMEEQSTNGQLQIQATRDHQSRNFGNQHAQQMDHHRRGRPFVRGIRGGRYGNRRHLPSDQPDKCTLEVRKLPHQLNTITKLNEFFSKFGTIVNLQVMYEGDPEAALVQFSTHHEALAAHRSPEAVLGNRFIKLFWHNKDQEKPNSVLDKNTNGEDEGENVKSNISKLCKDTAPTVASDSTGAKPSGQDALDEVKANSNGNLDFYPNEAANFGHRGVLSQPNAVQLPTRQQLTKLNIPPPATSPSADSPCSVLLTKSPSEQKKNKRLQKFEIKKKCLELVKQTSHYQTSVGHKLMNANKEDRSKLRKLFDTLDETRKQFEEDLKKVSEDLLRETKNPSKKAKKRPFALAVDASLPAASSPCKKSAIELN